MRNKRLQKFVTLLGSFTSFVVLSTSLDSSITLSNKNQLVVNTNKNVVNDTKISIEQIVNKLQAGKLTNLQTAPAKIFIKNAMLGVIKYYIDYNTKSIIIVGASDIAVQNVTFEESITLPDAPGSETTTQFYIRAIACKFDHCKLNGILSLPNYLELIIPNAFNNCDSIYQINLPYIEEPTDPSLLKDIDPNIKFNNAFGNLNNKDMLVTASPYLYSQFNSDPTLKERFGVDNSDIQEFGVNNIHLWMNGKDVKGWFKCNEVNKQFNEVTQVSDNIYIKNPSIGSGLSYAEDNIIVESCTEKVRLQHNTSAYTTTNVKTLKNSLFKDRTGLIGTLTIDSSVTTIESNVFDGCVNISEIRLFWTEQQASKLNINADWLGSLAHKQGLKIVVPESQQDWYKQKMSEWHLDNAVINPIFYTNTDAIISSSDLQKSNLLTSIIQESDYGLMVQLDDSTKTAYIINVKKINTVNPMFCHNFRIHNTDYKVAIKHNAFQGIYSSDNVTNTEDAVNDKDTAEEMMQNANFNDISKNNNSLNNESIFGIGDDNAGLSISEKMRSNIMLKGSLTIDSGITSIGEDAFDYCLNIGEINLSWTSEQANILKNELNPKWLGSLNKSKTLVNVPVDQLNWYLENKSSLGIDKCTINGNGGVDASLWIKGAKGELECSSFNNSSTIHISSAKDVVATDPYIKSDISIGTRTYLIDGIAASAFEGNSNLTGVLSIDSSITSIGSNAFNKCYGIKEIHLNWSKEQLKDLFESNSLISSVNSDWLGDLDEKDVKVVVPKGLEKIYSQYADNLGIDQCVVQEATTGNSNLSLPLSLGLGIGIPVETAIVCFTIYKIKKLNLKSKKVIKGGK